MSNLNKNPFGTNNSRLILLFILMLLALISGCTPVSHVKPPIESNNMKLRIGTARVTLPKNIGSEYEAYDNEVLSSFYIGAEGKKEGEVFKILAPNGSVFFQTAPSKYGRGWIQSVYSKPLPSSGEYKGIAIERNIFTKVYIDTSIVLDLPVITLGKVSKYRVEVSWAKVPGAEGYWVELLESGEYGNLVASTQAVSNDTLSVVFDKNVENSAFPLMDKMKYHIVVWANDNSEKVNVKQQNTSANYISFTLK